MLPHRQKLAVTKAESSLSQRLMLATPKDGSRVLQRAHSLETGPISASHFDLNQGAGWARSRSLCSLSAGLTHPTVAASNFKII